MKKIIQILLCITLTVFTAVNAFSQTGSLNGVVVESESRETIIGATIMFKDLGIGTATDYDGRYIIRNIPAGRHTVTFSYVGHETITLTDVEIKPDEQTRLDVVLSLGEAELDAITVTAYRDISTISSVLLDARYASQVTNGVSRQQIALSQDNNAAQVMQRIPGITISDNRFVFVRGLSERYNNVMINNSIAPSTEVDKRTFSFDLISSSSLDRMVVYKSGAPELPGDFAGGIIKLYTVENVDSNFLNFTLGTGYRAGTTGNPFMQSNRSGTDFLGFDSGFRQLPSNFSDSETLQNSARNSSLRIDNAHLLPNNFNPVERTAMADHSMGINFGINSMLGGKQLSTVTTINYSSGYKYNQKEFFRYFEWVDRDQPIIQRFSFRDDTYQQENKISVMSNWKLRFNQRNYISLKNLFNQIGENETIIRNGVDFIQRPDDQLRNYMLGYRSRSIYSGQLEGYHELTSVNSIRWVIGSSLMREKEPDLRRFRTFRSNDEPDANYSMQMPPSSNLFDTGRYFGNMNEYSLNNSLDFVQKFPFSFKELKLGYMVDYRNRDFSSRYLSYLYPGFFDPQVREELIRLPLDQIFSPENVKNDNGFIIEEGTRPIDSYDASNLTAAGYVSTEFEFNRLNLSGGVRIEHNTQKLNSRDDFQAIIVDNSILSILPFLNTTYSLHEKAQVRLGYGRTLNRPEFRELAPFVFYDYKMDAGRAGNPGLKSATIDNIDLRLELYPRIGETINIGAFYKFFDNPIENKTIVTTEAPQFSYINADKAISYGIELEFRKSLRGITDSEFLDRFSVNVNGSLIFTEVDLGEGATAQDRVRPLQGQSPYIVNTALYYDSKSRSASIVYNRIGPRIFSVGDVLFPTIYEMPRNSLDLTITQTLSNAASIKLGIQNLLNSPNRFFEDSDRDGKIDFSRDNPIISYKSGQLIDLSFTYRF